MGDRVKTIYDNKDNDILVEFDLADLTNQNWGVISELPSIIDDSGDVGKMELDIFKITINKMETYEKELIICER